MKKAAFENLKTVLGKEPVLKKIDPRKKTETSDASGQSVSGILT